MSNMSEVDKTSNAMPDQETLALTIEETGKDDRILVIGDIGIGKSSLIEVFLTGKPLKSSEVVPKDFRMNVDVDNKTVPVVFQEPLGEDHYSEIRSLDYSDSNATVLCFAIDNLASLTKASEKWYSEVKEHAVETPVVLVGLKSELRSDEERVAELAAKDLKLVSKDQGQVTSEKICAACCFECSAKTLENVNELFKAVAVEILKSK